MVGRGSGEGSEAVLGDGEWWVKAVCCCFSLFIWQGRWAARVVSNSMLFVLYACDGRERPEWISESEMEKERVRVDVTGACA